MIRVEWGKYDSQAIAIDPLDVKETDDTDDEVLALRTIDQAIRNALQKIDATNPALRNQLYRATWQTHEKMLAGLTQVTEAEKQQRREALKHIIHGIETEFQNPASPAPTAPAMTVQAAASTIPPTGASAAEGALELVAERDVRQETVAVGHTKKSAQKSFLRGNGFLLVLIAVLLFVTWSFYNSLIKPQAPMSSGPPVPHSVTDLIEQADTDASADPVTSARQQEATPASQRDWIRVFDPVDIANIRTQGRAKVQLYDEGGERFMRLSSQGEGDAILIEIGSGLMAHARGRSAIFNIVARSATGQLTRLSVACDAGSDASCGRWRFELPPMREDLLFRIDDVDEAQADQPLILTLIAMGENDENEHGVDIFGLEASFDE